MEPDRREHRRLAVHSPVIVSLGNSKVGLLFDISEGGLSVHGIVPDKEGQFKFVAFQLPKIDGLIVGRTEITWSSASANRTGLRFVQLGVQSTEQLRDWLSGS